MIDRINLSPASFRDLTEALLAPQFERAREEGPVAGWGDLVRSQ